MKNLLLKKAIKNVIMKNLLLKKAITLKKTVLTANNGQ